MTFKSAFGGSSSGFDTPDFFPAPSKNHVHGVGGLLKHLGTDIRDTAVGLPTGLVQTAEHPIRSLEQMGKTTWHDWSPLFHGDVGGFAHNFYTHPLGPILDVASVFTLGAGTAGKIAKLSTVGEYSQALKIAREAGEINPHAAAMKSVSKAARLGRRHDIELKSPTGEGPSMFKSQSHNPLSRARQQGARSLGHQLADYSPKWFSRFSTQGEYERALAKKTSMRGATAGSISRSVKSEIGRRVEEDSKAAAGANIASAMNAGRLIVQDPRAVYSVTEQVMHDNALRTAEKATSDQLGTRKGIAVAPKGWRFMRAEPTKFEAATAEGVELGMKTWAPRNTTRIAEKAAKDEHGNYLLVRDGEMKALGQEGANSARTLTKLYTTPTAVWKWTVLATRPAFFVNNTVGNIFMATAALGPATFARSFVDAVRNAHGATGRIANETGLDKRMSRAIRHTVGDPGDVIDQSFMGPHRLGFGQEQMAGGPKLSEALAKRGAPNGVVRGARVAEQGFLPITHRVAESWVRRVLLEGYLRKSDEVQGMLKQGHSFEDAVREAAKSPAFRTHIEDSVSNALGDYHHLNPVEKKIRHVVPFYTWDRAIMRHTAHLVKDKPLTAAILASTGQEGSETTKKLLGDIPQFMHGYLPLSLLGVKGKGGRIPTLSTTGLNPYATVPDVIDAGRALVSGQVKPGEAIATQVNPLVAGLIQTTTGQSLLSGAKLPKRPGGILGGIAASTFENTPPIQVIERLIAGTPQPHVNKRTGETKPFLAQKDLRHLLIGYAGLPLKNVSEEAASSLAQRETGSSKRKKRRKARKMASSFKSAF